MAVGVFYTVFRQTRAFLIRGMPQVETLATLALGEGLVGIIHRVRGHNMSQLISEHFALTALVRTFDTRQFVVHVALSNPPFSYVGLWACLFRRQTSSMDQSTASSALCR